jgi:hypothetical protein
MAITFVAAEQVGNFGSSTPPASDTCPKPAGVAAGDLLLAVLTPFSQNAEPLPPAGWTVLYEAENNPALANHPTCVMWKVAGGSEPSGYVFTQDDGGVEAYLGGITIVAFRGDAALSIDVSAEAFLDIPGDDEFDYQIPSITPTVEGCALVAVMTQVTSFNGGTAPENTPPAGYTIASDNGYCMVAHKLGAECGATGVLSGTKLTEFYGENSYHVALKEAGAEACPGGGGGASVTADAGLDQVADVGEPVTLDGTGSSAEGTEIGAYLWEQLSGPEAVELEGAETDTAAFTPSLPGTYVFRLTVLGDGAADSTDTVSIGVVADALDLSPRYPVEFEVRKKVLPGQSEPGARQAILKSQAYLFFPSLNFRMRVGDFEALRAAWESLYPAGTFVWTKPILAASGEFFFDSRVRATYPRPGTVEFSLALRAREPWAVTTPGSNVLPVTPSYGSELEPWMESNVSDSAAMRRVAAALSDGKRVYPLVFRNRYLAELLQMVSFWAYHYPLRKVVYADPLAGVPAGEYWIDSDFKGTWRGLNWVDYSFALREV